MTRWWMRPFMVGTMIACAAALAASSLPRLPDAISIPKSVDSPGQVIFVHRSHVDGARPDCTTCHPKLFSILPRRGAVRPAPLTHDVMSKGLSCGACHNGKTAFAVEDDCTRCHDVR